MVCFTYEQRARIWERSKELPKLTQKELAVWAKNEFNLQSVPAQSSISDTISKGKKLSAENLLNNSKQKKIKH